MNHPLAPSAKVRQFALWAALGGLLLLSYAVLAPFLAPFAWAAVLAYVTWPAHRRLRKKMAGRPSLAAALMTLTMGTVLVLPFAWTALMLQAELTEAYKALSAWLAQKPGVPPAIANLPVAGPWLADQLQQWLADPADLKTLIARHRDEALALAGSVAGGVGRNTAKFGIALLSLFFLYRDGETLVAQVRTVAGRFLGDRARHYLEAAGATTRAVVLGLTLTALAQGSLAGLGYWAAGLDSPVSLATFTALFAFIPFGTPVVWGAASAWLLLTGETGAAIGLFLWGALVVSWVDNLIRPLVVSAAVRLHFLLVFFGVLGGLAVFGLIGLFLGPVVLAVLVGVWREWLGKQAAAPPAGE
jgi:predicted PurR-regulated permease PerM